MNDASKALLNGGARGVTGQLCLFMAVLWLFAAAEAAYGGESMLRGFERDATQRPAEELRRSDSNRSSDDAHSNDDHRAQTDASDDSSGGFLWSVLNAFLGTGDSAASASESYREPVTPPPPSGQDARVDAPSERPPRPPYVWRPGSGFTPRLRVDYAQLFISSHIGATVVSVEGGDNHLGFLVSDTQFREREPDATLRLRNYYVMLRMSGDGGPELDLGAGGSELSGEEENSGIGYVARLRAQSQEGWAFEGRYGATSINGNDLSDAEIGVGLEGPFVAVKGGYRWLKSPNLLLDGPFLGISLRY